MPTTYGHKKKPEGLFPSQFYFTPGGGGPGNIFGVISKNGGGIESRVLQQESPVPRRSEKILIQQEIEQRLSRINTYICIDPETKIHDRDKTIAYRKKEYQKLAVHVNVGATQYTKHFDENTGLVSYLPKI